MLMAASEESFYLPTNAHFSVAVLLPCFNEAPVIRDVIRDFQATLLDAKVYVFDNNSTDDTALIATHAGAITRSEPFQGKGNVVRRMFADIDADLYVLADGDGTYIAQDVPRMIAHLLEKISIWLLVFAKK